MVRRTFGSIKAELARFAGVTGLNTSDARLKEYVNQATEEIMNEFDPPSVIDRLRFYVTTGHFVLPGDYDRVMMLTLDRIPLQMQSPWFEFIGYGLDPIQQGVALDQNQLDRLRWLEGVLDREDCATFTDFPDPGGSVLRVFGQVDERTAGVRPTILLQGYDVNGAWIRSASGNGYIDGLEVEINGDTAPFYIETTQTFSAISAAVKPVTKGNVYVYAMSATTGSTHVATYAPRETQPAYRRYFIPGLDTTQTHTVLARCRRRFVPIQNDSDWLLISNLPALKKMLQAVYYSEANKLEDALAYKAVAVDILKKEAKAYIGLQRQKPLITFSESMGVRGDGMYIL